MHKQLNCLSNTSLERVIYKLNCTGCTETHKSCKLNVQSKWKSKIRKYTQYFQSIKWNNSGDAIMFMLEIVVSLADRIANYQGKLMQYT